VCSDPALLERILGNLLSNAIRYTTAGRVVMGCRRRGDMLRIMVLDTGSGIPDHLQGEIFEEFFQITKATREHDRGLGLGLSIVKRTAEILGHSLSVRSQLHRGSAFAVDVPLARGERTRAVEREQIDHDGRIAGSFVLVIDDDAENRFAIEALCAQWGCTTLAVSSADAALASLEGHLRSPDLIITDYRLHADEIGTRGLTRIRTAVDATVPAIVITGDMTVQDADISAACAPAALLYKPINAEKLWSAADRLLEEMQPAAAVGGPA
jgi:CheY-like chemotaxis protein